MASSDGDDSFLELVENSGDSLVPEAAVGIAGAFPDGGTMHILRWRDDVDSEGIAPIDLARISKEAIETACTEPPDPDTADDRWQGVTLLICDEDRCEGSIGAYRCKSCGFIGTFDAGILGLPDCPTCGGAK